MWIRYVLIGVIALLVGALLGSRFLPAGRPGIVQPVIAALQPIPEGIQSWRFVVLDPKTGMVTVYEAGERLEIVGSARY